MRLLVFGGRDYTDDVRIFRELEAIHKATPITCLIHGACRGVDSLAADWAKANGIPDEPYRPDWQKHGTAAGPIRNQQMIDQGKPDRALEFPGGRGTRDMARKVTHHGIPLQTVKL